MPPETGSRVIDHFAQMRLKNPDERVHDVGWCEELARLGARVVRELLDEVLIGPAENVRWNALVRQVMLVEMLDEHVNNLIRDKRLPGSVGRRLVPVHREDAAQLFVGISHGAHRLGQHLADVRRGGSNIVPDSDSVLVVGKDTAKLRYAALG